MMTSLKNKIRDHSSILLFHLNSTFKKIKIQQSIATTHWKLTFTVLFQWNCSYRWHQLLPNYESQALSSGFQIADIPKILLNLAFVISCLLGCILSEYWLANLTCLCLNIAIPRGHFQFSISYITQSIPYLSKLPTYAVDPKFDPLNSISSM